ncbi:uncharacterized protein LOC121919621 isoform X1 [Sceloporus undulatus]|uniref:uncharacterized protein LOC121919621 isoform X1 n=1 Tax=Sceloporus undulatus TaxID=8520 RepID=UPI001C4CF9D3|nr:uncharacterized protein LOC121919621 isoform X1 [Sceloporus undulatus]
MDSHAVTESGASTQARGRVWSANEVLALLEIWKEQKLQNKLKKNYRNLDIFKDVADEMAKKNHVRSAEECRSKSKKMRFEYRKVVKHNQRSGSNPITCPFYRELEEIFHGDVSITPHRLSRSLDFEREGETTNVTEETASTSMANTGDGGTQETTTRQDSDEDSDDTCLDDTIINIPFTILESGPTQIAGSATGEQLGHLERRADGTSGGTDVRNDPDEEQEQPNVLLSPGTRLRSNRNRNRRARRGEHIARTIMQSASREAQLTRRTQERFMDIVHDSMKDCRRTEMELVNIMKEDVRRSAQDRQRMLQYMETMTELYRRKVDHECSLPTGQHVSVAQGTMHTSFRASPGDIPPSTPGPAVCTDFQEQPSTSYVGGQFQGNISPELFDELPPAYAPDGCPVTPTSNILDDDNTVENINRDVQNVVEVTDPPQNEGCIGTVQCVSNAGTSSLQCAVAPQQKQNKPCSSRTGRIIKKKKKFSP